MSTRSLNWLKFGGLVAFAFALGLLFAGLLDLPSRTSAQEKARLASAIPTVQAPSIPAAKPLIDLSEAFAAVADHVRPSVVYIKAQHTEKPTQQRLPPGMERFFPHFGQPQHPELEQGSGSGFIVSSDGYILTNNHVVEGAETVIVRLLDHREFKAKVVGTDPNTDVAVLRIDAKGLPPVALGNSDDARVGSWVLAIGNPLGEGLTFTVTSGIVSAKGRALQSLPNRGVGSIQDFIQTDAAINPGNSGGPLVSVRGEVIGINSAIASQTGFYSGYGFAIPINLVRTVMNQLITDGKVHRAALGVSIANVSLNDAQYVGLPEIRGVVVKDIPNADSPAKKAGIEAGDIIIAIDGKPVEYVGQLQQVVGFRKPGDVVKVEVARKGGVRKTFDVKLEALEDEPQVADRMNAPTIDTEAVEAGGSLLTRRMGVSVQALTPQIAQELQIPADARGVLVTNVVPGGPSWDVLFDEETGGPDVIVAVEGKPVKSEADLRAAVKAQKPGSVISLRVYSPSAHLRRVERIKLSDAQ
ncbi:MAG TPA: trypsin-like peptidase domain-containing protein [Gemmatimonadales bacterium]|nr:trypsin-like peptidase domain-containing protein [Gemmatimonadales bacterium]